MIKNKNQYQFSEGEVHTFKVKGITTMPDTNELYYILENQKGGKHLLKALHYKHYNIQVNQAINCKIDKINCSGKIYLEPENPFYKEGESYNFNIIDINEQVNSVGELEKIVKVKDVFDKEAACYLPVHFNTALLHDEITCKVVRIKKGQLFLLHSEKETVKTFLEINQTYWFILSEIKKLGNNIEYYILTDRFGNLYSLKKDMYEHYGFRIGQEIECIVTKYNTDGNLKIEPAHPYYQVGKVYSFEYLKTIEEKDVLGNIDKVIIVKDIYGIETKARNLNSVFDYNDIPNYLSCKVEGIRKGKAILSIV